MKQINLEDVDFIDIMFSDLSSIKLEKDNILECSCEYIQDMIDSSIVEEAETQNVNLIQNLLLCIKNYKRVYSYDKQKFNPKRNDIAQLYFYLKNGNEILCYANMTDQDKNDNQFNVLDGNKLFINIEEKF